MNKIVLTSLAFLFCFAQSASAAASNPQELTWDDLVPASAIFDDPFTRLDDDQLYELTLVAGIRDRQAAGEAIDEKSLELYREMLDSLREQDIDVDGLLAMREKVTEERIAKTYLANSQLDGKQVRIPGYLLPLEFDGKRVTEFLLVPYVGACIHTPPPPPNQIVHVKSKQGYVTEGGLFTPVWVNGVMRTEQSSADLSLVDGSSTIPTAYTLNASAVTSYE